MNSLMRKVHGTSKWRFSHVKSERDHFQNILGNVVRQNIRRKISDRSPERLIRQQPRIAGISHSCSFHWWPRSTCSLPIGRKGIWRNPSRAIFDMNKISMKSKSIPFRFVSWSSSSLICSSRIRSQEVLFVSNRVVEVRNDGELIPLDIMWWEINRRRWPFNLIQIADDGEDKSRSCFASRLTAMIA
jgi:hypothetical protein